jgi:hypothetical protein
MLIGSTNISPVLDSHALVAQITESVMKKISDNMKSNQQNYEDSLDSDEDNIDSVTTPLDSATYDYECMDPRVYSAKFSAFKKLVDNFDLLDALKKVT